MKKSLFEKCLDFLFRREDLVPPDLPDEVYLVRWTLLRLFGRAVYLHKFIGDDWTRDPHDHPKDFISIGLSGEYYEEIWTHAGGAMFRRTYYRSAPWIRRFPAETVHRIELGFDKSPCWTLAIAGKRRRDWGFYDTQTGAFTLFDDYIAEREDASRRA